MGLTEQQQLMVKTWEQHGYAEFGLRDADAAIATMSPHPYILCVPLGQLLYGRDEVYSFYANDFLCKMPSFVEMEPMSRVIGENHIVDEFLFRFVHDVEMPWKIPGVAPTGRRVEVVMNVQVGFDGDKIAYEHLMWDHASVLTQIGLIDLPAAAIGGVSPDNLRKVLKK
ncbi:nuclear transport factor 2 family protein [Novosphingobium sp. KN65.2]|uniref:nuclear transport factor 2 family protein n=1 Tax=Novosphingobium sp. KN65.2 TaxID=1478134 RepID=UPI0005DDAEAB|nr:nuclear transport factor 2 family protein [Novosphingobium sp. KN65.2]CDO38647.1 Carboxymethylenebutenolidase [Novosphingobium sp. KN65.2]